MANHFEDEEVSEEIPVHVAEEAVFEEEESPAYWRELSRNTDTEFRLILDNLDKSWCWSSLSVFRTWEEISAHPTLPWVLEEVSRNLAVTESIVLENPNFPWHAEGLSENDNISFEFMMQRPEWNWSWNKASVNRSLKIEHVLNHMEWEWDWCALTGFNPSITMDVIEAHLELPWVWSSVGYNLTFNREFVDRHPELGINPVDVNYALARGDSEEFARLERLRREQQAGIESAS